MAYTMTLWVHSWLRWAVLGLGMAAVGRALLGWRSRRPWGVGDRRLQLAFVTSVDIQFLLGLLLYFVLSPLTPKSGEAWRASMRVPWLRFFAIEHTFTMLLAVATFHVASVLSRKAPDDAGRHRRWWVGVAAGLLIIAVGIPWPGLSYGRPLLRLP
ncbi:MAG TPA: hypothetical protein VEY30_02395 [Myxococcaceae bacterium]|nr:hypothetical protein [Myxococcaceae bacterium]